MKRTYTILGATGNIGHVIAENLLGKGHMVKALGRDPKKLEAMKAKGAATASPAVDQPGALAESFRGADGLFIMTPPDYNEADFSAYQDRAARAVTEAVKKSGITHAVHLSSIGADQPQGTAASQQADGLRLREHG